MEPSTADGSPRRHERRPLRTNAMLRIPGAPPLVVRTLDISAGGIAVVASRNSPPGTDCSIAIAPPTQPRGTPTISIPARVAHSIFSLREDGFILGLQYGELSEHAIQAITRFLDGV